MDPATVALVVQSVSAGLGALAQVAPSVAAAFTGGRPVEEVLADARKAVEALPTRTGEGGAWEADLKARVDGGEKRD